MGATSSLTQSSMKQFRLSSLMRDSTPRPSSCMSASLVSPFSVFFLSSIISEARKEALDPSQLRLEPMAAMSTLSGFPRPTFALLDQGRPAHDRGKLRIQLVLTPTRDNGEVKSDPVNKDLMFNK